MIVVDTTILVYAVGGEHAAREPSRRLVAAIGAGSVPATTTPEVLQEFAHVYARRRPRAEATRYARRYAVLLGPLLTVNGDDLERGLALYERHSDLGAFDAVLAAAALGRDADAFVSADTAFGGIRGLRLVQPGTPELDALVAA